MTGKHAIEVKNPEKCDRVEYVMDILLAGVGYPYRFVDNWQHPVYRIKCGGARDSDVDLWCPNNYPSGTLKKTTINGTTILYRREKPQSLRDESELRFDIINIPFQLLTREKEGPWFKNSSVPQFPAYNSELYELGILDEPVLDQYINLLKRWIDEAIYCRAPGMTPLPKWKNDSDFSVVLSHDVDCLSPVSYRLAWRYFIESMTNTKNTARERFEYFVLSVEQIYKTLKRIGRGKPKSNLRCWLDLEEKYGFRSTFYFAAMSERSRRDPTYYLEDKISLKGTQIRVSDIIRTLNNNKWEIGLHGSLKSYKSSSQLEFEKERLEALTGASVEGIRQHCLYFEPEKTWEAQAEAGFKYDSTLGYNERLGYRSGLTLPYPVCYQFTDADKEFYELPMSIQDNVLFYHEPTSTDYIIRRVKRRLEKVKDMGGSANLLWHPYCIRNIRWPEPLEAYEEILRYLDGQNVFVTTASNLRRYWHQRRCKLKV